jgi:hypothetical protein
MPPQAPSMSLRAVLTELGWSVPALARAVNAMATRQGHRDHIDLRTPRRWVDGGRPGPPWDGLTVLVLAEALGRPVAGADLGWPDADRVGLPATAGLCGRWTFEEIRRGLVGVMAESGPARRTVFMVAGAALTEPALGWLTAAPARAEGAEPAKGRGQVSMEVAAGVDRVAGELRRLDDQLGGGGLLELAEASLARVGGLLSDRTYAPQVGRRLMAASAELSRIAGRACRDVGQEGRAQRYFVSGLRAAHAAGDRAMGANILGFMSRQARDLGQAQEAVRLTEAARAGCSVPTGRVAAMVQSWLAQAYAAAGDGPAARRCLDAMFEAIQDLDRPVPEWAYWLNEGLAHHSAGRSLLSLGQWRDSREHLGVAVDSFVTEFPSEALSARLALARAWGDGEGRDLDRCAAMALVAVRTLASGEVESEVCAQELRCLCGQLRPHRRVPAVRELLDQARPLLAAG